MVEVTWAGIVASAARGGEAGDKIRVLSRSQSRLPHSEHFCNLAKARLLRHLSRRFAVVDSCPEAGVALTGGPISPLASPRA
jgi:hypothetical protein